MLIASIPVLSPNIKNHTTVSAKRLSILKKPLLRLSLGFPIESLATLILISACGGGGVTGGVGGTSGIGIVGVGGTSGVHTGVGACVGVGTGVGICGSWLISSKFILDMKEIKNIFWELWLWLLTKSFFEYSYFRI